MSPAKQALLKLAQEMHDHETRAENSAKSFALSALRGAGKERDDAMLHLGRAEGYRGASQILEDAARGID